MTKVKLDLLSATEGEQQQKLTEIVHNAVEQEKLLSEKLLRLKTDIPHSLAAWRIK
ncbi:MAG: hypothetical protein ACXWWC_15515 [Chitinophagaceae bacterium]